MKMLLVKKACLLYLAIGMIVLLTVIVDDAFGSGPTCSSPCAIYSFDYCTGSWGCQGCDSCSHCNTSTATCVYDCKPICMDCNSIANPSGCGGIITGCTSYLCSPEKCETCDGHGLCKVCGGDPNKACCNGTCYDTRTQKCCDEFSPPHICLKEKVCCEGGCCPKDYSCCGSVACCSPDQCCDSPEVGPPYCKPKCTNTAQCDYGTLPTIPPLFTCANIDPGAGGGCEDYIEGEICNYVVNIHVNCDAKCASCAPGCLTHSGGLGAAGVCATITTCKCVETCNEGACICQCLPDTVGWIGIHCVCGP